MMMTLMILAPPLAAVGMMLWLRHARQTSGHRWIGHWLATLLPVGLLVALTPIASYIPDALFAIPLALGAMGAAAFAGGGLYLAVSALAASETVQAAGVSAVDSFREAVNSTSWTKDEIYYYHHYWHKGDDNDDYAPSETEQRSWFG